VVPAKGLRAKHIGTQESGHGKERHRVESGETAKAELFASALGFKNQSWVCLRRIYKLRDIASAVCLDGLGNNT
jgi:hypothetical protein